MSHLIAFLLVPKLSILSPPCSDILPARLSTVLAGSLKYRNCGAPVSTRKEMGTYRVPPEFMPANIIGARLLHKIGFHIDQGNKCHYLDDEVAF